MGGPLFRYSIFFLDAPGGTGKTFVIKLLLAEVRRNGNIALAVASSGIAATLLPGGRTAHSALKLPFNLFSDHKQCCNINKRSNLANMLQKCDLIVWDEATMSHKAALEAVNTSLKDIRNSHQLMGGLTLLLSGDFRQTLPIIPRGTKADELQACIKSSFLWRHVQVYSLTTNMRTRLLGSEDAEEFAENVLSIGNGTIDVDRSGYFDASIVSTRVASRAKLIENVFPDLEHNYVSSTWLSERAILAPRNDSVDALNVKLLSSIPGDAEIYKSIDSAMSDDEAVDYPIEFLNSWDPPGMPPHLLRLKVGCPVMLLRNILQPKLCNGTRLVVVNLYPNIVEAIINSGCGTGETVFIPKIPLVPSNHPFKFERLQFPLRLCFAMTINKSQGQTLKIAGLDLGQDCFSHGQLYVGASRVGSKNNLFVYSPLDKVKNIVYEEVFSLGNN